MDHPQFDVGNKPFDTAHNPDGFGPETPPAKQRGCFFYGCIIALVLAALGLVLAGVLAFTAYRFLNGVINDYTSTAPVPLPKVEMPADDRKSLDERWAAFRAAQEKNEAAEIVLNADEINVLLAENEQVRDKVHVSIDDDKVSAQISYPLSETGIPGTRGRFLNGRATTKVRLIDGELDVRIQDLEVNGKVMPPNLKSQFAGENLAKEYNKNSDSREMFRKLESLVVKDGKVTLKARSGKGEDEKSEAKPKDKDDDAERDGPAAAKPKDPDKDAREKEKAKDKGDTTAPDSPTADEPEKKAEAPKAAA